MLPLHAPTATRHLSVACSAELNMLCQDVAFTSCTSTAFFVQWNLSIEDAFRTQLAVLYREVSLIQR